MVSFPIAVKTIRDVVCVVSMYCSMLQKFYIDSDIPDDIKTAVDKSFQDIRGLLGTAMLKLGEAGAVNLPHFDATISTPYDNKRGEWSRSIHFVVQPLSDMAETLAHNISTRRIADDVSNSMQGVSTILKSIYIQVELKQTPTVFKQPFTD